MAPVTSPSRFYFCFADVSQRYASWICSLYCLQLASHAKYLMNLFPRRSYFSLAPLKYIFTALFISREHTHACTHARTHTHTHTCTLCFSRLGFITLSQIEESDMLVQGCPYISICTACMCLMTRGEMQCVLKFVLVLAPTSRCVPHRCSEL